MPCFWACADALHLGDRKRSRQHMPFKDTLKLVVWLKQYRACLASMMPWFKPQYKKNKNKNKTHFKWPTSSNQVPPSEVPPPSNNLFEF
jgi:hypothetical protein